MLIDVAGRPIASKKPELAITDPKLALFASQADTAFKLLDLTVVCLSCGGTPQMRNHPADPNWKMECACTVRVLKNPRN